MRFGIGGGGFLGRGGISVGKGGIGGGVGSGPFHLSGGTGGKRGNSGSSDDGALGFFFMALLVLLMIALVVALFSSFVIASFSLMGPFLLHLMGNTGIKNKEQRSWLGIISTVLGIFGVIYLKNRGGLGSEWNYVFPDTRYRSYDIGIVDLLKVIFELCLWSTAIGFLTSVPMHQYVCKTHNPSGKRFAISEKASRRLLLILAVGFGGFSAIIEMSGWETAAISVIFIGFVVSLSYARNRLDSTQTST